MRVPHALRVEAGADRFGELLSALGAAGLRFGWLEWEEPEPLPESLLQAAQRGALRAVAVGNRISVAVKPRQGRAVVRDLVREHFRGCAVVLVRGGSPGSAATLAPGSDGEWRITDSAGRSLTHDTPALIGRLRSPLPLG